MPFKLSTRESLCEFDQLCLDYGTAYNFMVTDLPALRLLFDALNHMKLAERIKWHLIALAYDLKINLVHSYFDIAEIAGLENEYWVGVIKNDNPKGYLTPIRRFGVAMMRARAAFDLIMRTRAIWDKLFRYIGQLYAPELYSAALRKHKDSPRKALFSISERNGLGPLSSDDITQIKKDIQHLEEIHRTPEAHGYGSIRLWAYEPFANWPIKESGEIIGHWNLLHSTIAKVFAEASTSNSSLGVPGK